jgi:RsiW-degrading membrane proteinase PrsW (M82 family)
MNTLTWSSWVLLLVVPGTGLLLALDDVTNIFTFALLLVAPSFFIWSCYIRFLRERCQPAPPDNQFVRLFFAGAGPGALLSIFVEGVVAQQLAKLIIGSNEQATSTDILLYALATAFVTAALVEEAVKATLVRCAGCGCWCGQHRDALRPYLHAHTTIAMFLAVTIGFATAENVMYVFLGARGKTPEEAAARVLLVIVRSALSLPLHVVSASYTALRLTVRDAQRGLNDAQWAAAYALSYLHLAPNRGNTGISSEVPRIARARPDLEGFDVQRHLGNLVAGTDYINSRVEVAGPAESLFPHAAVVAAPTPPRLTSGLPAPAHTTLTPLPVWSWVRVLWPAVVIHGTFDAVAMLLPVVAAGVLSDAETALVVLLSGGAVLFFSAAVLLAQFISVFETIAVGTIPRSVTIDTRTPLFRPLVEALRWALCSCQRVQSVPGADAAAAVSLADHVTARMTAPHALVHPSPAPLPHVTAPVTTSLHHANHTDSSGPSISAVIVDPISASDSNSVLVASSDSAEDLPAGADSDAAPLLPPKAESAASSTVQVAIEPS